MNLPMNESKNEAVIARPYSTIQRSKTQLNIIYYNVLYYIIYYNILEYNVILYRIILYLIKAMSYFILYYNIEPNQRFVRGSAARPTNRPRMGPSANGGMDGRMGVCVGRHVYYSANISRSEWASRRPIY